MDVAFPSSPSSADPRVGPATTRESHLMSLRFSIALDGAYLAARAARRITRAAWPSEVAYLGSVPWTVQGSHGEPVDAVPMGDRAVRALHE